MIRLSSFLILAAVLFACGVSCILIRRNLIRILMGVELLWNAASLNFVAFSSFQIPANPSGAGSGQAVVLFIMGLAAAEAVIALALVLAVYRVCGRIEASGVNLLKG